MGAKVSVTSKPSTCEKPWATNLALYFSHDLSALYLAFQTHLVPITLRLGGWSTSSQVSFFMMLSYSDCMAAFHFGFSKASSTFVGSLTKRIISAIKAILTICSEALLCSSILFDMWIPSVKVFGTLTLGLRSSKSY